MVWIHTLLGRVLQEENVEMFKMLVNFSYENIDK